MMMIHDSKSKLVHVIINTKSQMQWGNRKKLCNMIIWNLKLTLMGPDARNKTPCSRCTSPLRSWLLLFEALLARWFRGGGEGAESVDWNFKFNFWIHRCRKLMFFVVRSQRMTYNYMGSISFVRCHHRSIAVVPSSNWRSHHFDLMSSRLWLYPATNCWIIWCRTITIIPVGHSTAASSSFSVGVMVVVAHGLFYDVRHGAPLACAAGLCVFFVTQKWLC